MPAFKKLWVLRRFSGVLCGCSNFPMEQQPVRVKLAQDPWSLIWLLEVFLVFLSGEQGVKWLIFFSRPTADKAITYHLLSSPEVFI
jgi:hypothetical protein